MSIKSAPCYWVTCDHPGCNARPEDGDFTIWDYDSDAIDAADAQDWLILGKNRDKHICSMHRDAYECRSCGEAFPEPVPGDGDGILVCVDCRATLDEFDNDGPCEPDATGDGDIVDLLDALQRSVERARAQCRADAEGGADRG